ncbi:MAG TPA: amidohydrolase family protein [Candidatus Acidoferrales bacterium]|nr:amidohydrolase family protein [Candidatus Acidoferrales bacterium]
MADFKLISADGHLNDPPAAWERVQKEYGERAPRVVDNLPDRKGLWLVADGLKPSPCCNPSVGFLVAKPEGVSGMDVDQVDDETIARFRETFRYEDHPGSWDPAARIKEQERDGVEAEVLFSSWARIFYVLKDAAFQRSCFRSYNFWLHDFCTYDPKRLIGIPLLSILDIEKAVLDMQEYAQLGFKGVQIPPGIKDGAYYDPMYEPIWAAAEDLDMLVVIHSGQLQGGESRRWFAKLNSADEWPGFFQHSRQTVIKTVIGHMIFSGLFDRHPKLKVICTEFEAGWLGVIVQQVDYQYGPKKTAHGTTLDDSMRLKLPPSEYFRRNLWFTFMDDRAAVLTTPIYGEDNFMWASDYPHAACTWPYSHRIVDRLFQGAGDRIKRKLCRDNVNQVYGLGL